MFGSKTITLFLIFFVTFIRSYFIFLVKNVVNISKLAEGAKAQSLNKNLQNENE